MKYARSLRFVERREADMVLSVAVAGATGYAGGEALRILAEHPDFEVTCVAGHSSSGDRFFKHAPHSPSLGDLIVEDTTPDVLNGHDVIVLALPHGASGALAAELDPEAIVIDLGADHRLENKTAWDEYYGGQYYSNWVYGLPELIVGQNSDGTYRYQQAALRSAKRIAGPGCNVTAVTLAIQPGIAEGFIEGDIVADLAVGYSGAGKNLKKTFLLGSEAMGSATAYSVGGTHRHIPEIMQNLAHASGLSASESYRFSVGFTPMLVPMSRGILATVSAALTDKGLDASDEQIRSAWQKAYEKTDFITLLPEDMLPATNSVSGSNSAHVQVAVDRKSRRLYAFAAIDNLNRGTAGQAVESLNIALGKDEQTGLTSIGVAP